MDDNWVPIQVPDNLDDMFEAFVSDQGEKVGWCLLCNSAIRTEDDLLPNSNTHDCEKGRALEAEIEQQKPTSRCRSGRGGHQ